MNQEFQQMMQRLLGVRAEAFFRAMEEEPSVAVRLNSRKPLSRLPFEPDGSVTWCDTGRYLATRPLFTAIPALHAGAFYVQDASSMVYRQIISRVLKESGMPSRPAVLDLCAAPGGKTTAIIDALPDGSPVVANEFVGRRAVILRENLQKWGYPDIIVTNGDAASLAASGQKFDIIAVDAPCSGEGMMRKEEEARLQWTPRLVDSCARLQREILTSASTMLSPGGMLIYSTCTFNEEEDDRNALFIRDSLGFTPVDLKLRGIPEECGALSATHGLPGLRFMPHITRGEGLYVCAFRKETSDDTGNAILSHRPPTPLSPSGKTRSRDHRRPGKGTHQPSMPDVSSWTSLECNRLFGDTLYGMSAEISRLTDALQPHVNIMQSGVAVADLKGKEAVPHTALSLSTALNRNAFPTAELTDEEALSYLRGNAVTLPGDTPRGFVAVATQGLPLGWVKNLGTRANNLYPKPWRIRNA